MNTDFLGSVHFIRHRPLKIPSHPCPSVSIRVNNYFFRLRLARAVTQWMLCSLQFIPPLFMYLELFAE